MYFCLLEKCSSGVGRKSLHNQALVLGVQTMVPTGLLCIPCIAFPPLPLGTLDILECFYFYCYSGYPLLTLTLHLPLNCFLYCFCPSFVFPFQAEKKGRGGVRGKPYPFLMVLNIYSRVTLFSPISREYTFFLRRWLRSGVKLQFMFGKWMGCIAR